MRKLHVVAVLFLLVATAVSQTAPRQSNKAPEVIERLRLAIRANGGDQTLADTVIHVTLSEPSLTTRTSADRTLTLITRGNNATKLSDATHAVVLRAGKTERQDDQGALQRVRDPNERARRIEHLPVLFLREVLEKDEYQCVIVAATDDVPEHLRVSRLTRSAVVDERLAHNYQTEIFIDPNTQTISKLAFVMVSTNDWRRTIPVEIVYEDYRDVKGVKVSFKQTKYVAGQFHSELTLRDVAFDTGTTDADFGGAR